MAQLGAQAPVLSQAGVPQRVLRVGPGERFSAPSAAAGVAEAGDRVLIAPGRYRDCAVWRAPGLEIVAAPGGAVVIEGPVCEGKALFVTAAPGIVVRGLTFRGARAEAGNGAGIRAEAGDLTVRDSVFEDNENGILTQAQLPGATLRVEDSRFAGNGALRAGHDCAHGIYAGRWALVSVQRSRFTGTRACHHIKSRALRTEILDSRIEDGPTGDSSYLVDIPNGGDLLLRGSTLRKGPRSGNPAAVVSIGAEGVRNPTLSLRVEDNVVENRMARPTTFVVNRSDVPAALAGNRLAGAIVPLAGPGTAR